MSDLIQLSDDVRLQIGSLASAFAQADVPVSFKSDMTEEEMIALCVYFLNLTLKMGLPLMAPMLLIALKGAHELATDTGDAEQLTTLRKLLAK